MGLVDRGWVVSLVAGVLIIVLGSQATGAIDQSRPDQGCRKVMLSGEVNAGQEWKVGIGEGWVFRLMPIPGSGRGYTG